MASVLDFCKVEPRAQWALAALAALALLAAQCAPRAAAVPTQYSTALRNTDHECLRDENIEALCQRCAKSTKSTMVYPMCCTNQEEVREWCVRYLDYGLQ